MSGADYYCCDVCGAKTFYDAELNYHNKRCVLDPVTRKKLPYGASGMAVICEECATDYKAVIYRVKQMTTKTFKIAYKNPITGEIELTEKSFEDTPTFPAAMWAEDYAYTLADKGWYKVTELKDKNEQ